MSNEEWDASSCDPRMSQDEKDLERAFDDLHQARGRTKELDAEIAALKDHITRRECDLDDLDKENAALRAELEKCKAENRDANAELELKGDCLYHRCTTHYQIAQINKSVIGGAECGACIEETVHLKWQTGPIPANGWYWVFQDTFGEIISVKLCLTGDTVTGLSIPIVRWAGPIPEPEVE